MVMLQNGRGIVEEETGIVLKKDDNDDNKDKPEIEEDTDGV